MDEQDEPPIMDDDDEDDPGPPEDDDDDDGQEPLPMEMEMAMDELDEPPRAESEERLVLPPPPPPPPPQLQQPQAGPSTGDAELDAQPAASKKRKRTKSGAAKQRRAESPQDTASLIVPRAPHARSPTPPTQVLKSSFGGNHFTQADVDYLNKYIQYCQDQGQPLSLREICEKVAEKAPHHSFYSWRRYCNKKQIRLGAYAMNLPPSGRRDADGETDGDRRERDMDEEYDELDPSRDRSGEPEAGPPPESEYRAPLPPAQMSPARPAQSAAPPERERERTPSPPRQLYRSTTGKGVAFTDEDVAFLVAYLAHRRKRALAEDGAELDMVAFWKDLAAKAPHHSRASWMKYWRRHKHEIEPSADDEPLPERPAKKMRYSRDDDVLLAKHFVTQRDGTSDQIFQNFARLHPHHPWKGWQEHHRIHKVKIEEMTDRIKKGETVD